MLKRMSVRKLFQKLQEIPEQERQQKIDEQRRWERRIATEVDCTSPYDVMVPEAPDDLAGLVERYVRVMVDCEVSEELERRLLPKQPSKPEKTESEKEFLAFVGNPEPKYAPPSFPLLTEEDEVRLAEEWAHSMAENNYSCGICALGPVPGQYSIDDHPLSHAHSWEDNVRLYESERGWWE